MPLTLRAYLCRQGSTTSSIAPHKRMRRRSRCRSSARERNMRDRRIDSSADTGNADRRKRAMKSETIGVIPYDAEKAHEGDWFRRSLGSDRHGLRSLQLRSVQSMGATS